MKPEHYAAHLSNRFALEITKADQTQGEILEGRLISKVDHSCNCITGGIPRFVTSDNYAANFGLQWNKFKSTQLDSYTGLPLSANRFWNNTKWTPEELAGKTVLEVGCGAGRFTEIFLKSGANVIGVDYSSAVEANRHSNASKGDLFLMQADLYDLPLRDDYFEFVFCFGVLQHTPDPVRAYKSIFRKLKPGGKLAIDYYRKRFVPTPFSTPKYVWRPITSRMRPEKLLRIVQWYIPHYLPIDTFLRRVPWIGRVLVAVTPIPCWNYLDCGLPNKQRLEWAVMDTFDALGAAYDKPKTLKEVRQMVASDENERVEVFYGSNGIVANVTKRASS